MGHRMVTTSTIVRSTPLNDDAHVLIVVMLNHCPDGPYLGSVESS
jgi:hypothetical protein